MQQESPIIQKVPLIPLFLFKREQLSCALIVVCVCVSVCMCMCLCVCIWPCVCVYMCVGMCVLLSLANLNLSIANKAENKKGKYLSPETICFLLHVFLFNTI